MEENYLFAELFLKFYYTVVIAHFRLNKEQKNQELCS